MGREHDLEFPIGGTLVLAENRQHPEHATADRLLHRREWSWYGHTPTESAPAKKVVGEGCGRDLTSAPGPEIP